MNKHRKRLSFLSQGRWQSGFTLAELMVSSMLFLVGLVAVAELVPASLNLYLWNRNDSSALTYAQRELVQFLEQPLSANFLAQDADGNPCSLGDPNSPDTVVGSPLVPNAIAINYTANPVPGYSAYTRDQNDPSGASYDIRWAVITSTKGSTVVSKRFIVGAWRRGGNGAAPPVTLDAWVQK